MIGFSFLLLFFFCSGDQNSNSAVLMGNIDSSETERVVTRCFVFISDGYADKKSWS